MECLRRDFEPRPYQHSPDSALGPALETLPLSRLDRRIRFAERIPMILRYYCSKDEDPVLLPYSDFGLEVLQTLRAEKNTAASMRSNLAHMLTETTLADLPSNRLVAAGDEMISHLRASLSYLYQSTCPQCGVDAETVCILYKGNQPQTMRISCHRETDLQHLALCGEAERKMDQHLHDSWPEVIKRSNLWVPPFLVKAFHELPKPPAWLPHHSGRSLIVLAAMIDYIKQVSDPEMRSLLFLCFTHMLIEHFPIRYSSPASEVWYDSNLLRHFQNCCGIISQQLSPLHSLVGENGDKAQLSYQKTPGVELSLWPKNHGYLLCSELSRLTEISPLFLAALWADGLHLGLHPHKQYNGFKPRCPLMNSNLESANKADLLPNMISELRRVIWPGGHILLGCGGLSKKGMSRLLFALQREGLEVQGVFQPPIHMQQEAAIRRMVAYPPILHARKPIKPSIRIQRKTSKQPILQEFITTTQSGRGSIYHP
jgi:hypothetical protein